MLNPDFKDILFEFSAAGVEYIVVGAQAMATHGLVRSTGDLDLFVRPSVENSARIYEALKKFGAPLESLSPSVFTDKDLVFQIGVEPQRIDLLTALDAMDFQQAWANHKTAVLDGLSVPVLSVDDLITNKTAARRPKDLADVEWLKTLLPRP